MLLCLTDGSRLPRDALLAQFTVQRIDQRETWAYLEWETRTSRTDWQVDIRTQRRTRTPSAGQESSDKAIAPRRVNNRNNWRKKSPSSKEWSATRENSLSRWRTNGTMLNWMAMNNRSKMPNASKTTTATKGNYAFMFHNWRWQRWSCSDWLVSLVSRRDDSLLGNQQLQDRIASTEFVRKNDLSLYQAESSCLTRRIFHEWKGISVTAVVWKINEREDVLLKFFSSLQYRVARDESENERTRNNVLQHDNERMRAVRKRRFNNTE